MARPPQLTGTGGRATILDVAAAAGVSRQTVTRAVNGLPGISTATKERVLAAAAALDYRPSRFGRGLVSGGAHQLGLLVDDLRNPYSPELAAAVLRLAAARGWNVLLADVGLAGDSDRSVQDLGAQSDVVIGYLGARAPEWIERLGSVPVVELDPHGVPARGAVRLDPTDAVEALADHLVAVGVKHPLVLDAPASAPGEPSTRGALLLDALRRRGYLPEHVHAQAASADAGAAGTTAALERHARLDAVVAFNDVMALGALAACRRAGAEVPDRVRVVGIDGLTLGTLVAPTLTTLAVDLDEVARHAVDLALGMLDGALPRSGPSVERVVRHRLVVRESA
ncbi:LacI family DNA-binding transcriptional regulator [Curtobacterium herbarum]|uniref:LacI family DNA-binding transcriptional regulator n=2 Tax=Curtobacterium herbarum TaxID=150122 RepID=UPI00195F02FE|nr:LacI family DNA-binding transcriptional regulator [Curtobacterium herbarum]MBM7474787.1 DNA-binding LacI/PurR family transcriptional regulator [Curtobacterium herbarum]MCS6545436.1 LacI family transcriptional regulator [Curtobacterium herbarum]